ncbi:MAG: KamA family radical SAM protein [Alphaproteobacteria bacterium]|nr:KamA family radical SAM protein [Alphaproteobacteria bacterium]
MLRERPALAGVWAAADRLFPVRVTRSWWARVDAADADDPLARQVLPAASELVAHAGDLDDPVGDRVRSPVPWVVHKHPDRVLLLLTKRCHVYCRYCFRRTLAPGEHEDPDPEAWRRAMAYATGCGAREAILSGGDPLAVRDAHLFDTIDTLRDGGIKVVRLHSRAPVTYPRRVTDALVAGLAARGPVWVVVHVNHPRELSPDVDAALARLVDAGLPVLNQSVLLAGVNDDVDVLVALSEALVERRVRPYYLHQTDAVTGNAAFRVDPHRGVALHRALRARVSGIAAPRYVVDPPDGSGKIDVEDWLARCTR